MGSVIPEGAALGIANPLYLFHDMPLAAVLLLEVVKQAGQRNMSRSWELFRLFCTFQPEGRIEALSMNKLIFLIVLAFFSNCSTQDQKNERTIAYLRDNFSHDWTTTRTTDKQIRFSQQFYKTALKGDDQLVFKRAYLVTFEQTNYVILDFDFKDSFDGRLMMVFNDENGEFIGYFERSLA